MHHIPKSSTQSTLFDRYGLIAIITVAVLLRLVMALLLGNFVQELPGTADQLSYDMLAQRVVSGHGFTVSKIWWPLTQAGEPTAHWSYLYTLYLAAVYSLVGYQPLVARLIQAVLAGLLMPWLAYRLASRQFNRQIGLITAGLTAVYLYFIYYSAALVTETFYIIAILWVLDLASELGAKPSPTEKSSPRLLWLRLGLALGITVLLRQVFLLFLPFLFGWLLWRCYQARTRSFFQMISILSGATVILILMILPWTIRNYQAFNRFVLLNTNAGFAFYWGNHPVHGYDFISILPAGGPSYQSLIPKEYRRLDEAAMDQALLKDALTIIKNDPVRYAILSLSRFKDYFMFWPTPDSGLISNLSRVLSFGLLWPFMAYSFVRYAGGALRSEALLLYFFVMVYTLIHLLTWTLIRYRLPVDAVLLIFAALTIVEIANRIKQRRGKHERLYQPVLIRPEE